jgi:hypothetical protein
MVTTLDSYRIVTNDLTRSLKTTSKQPQVARQTDNYLADIGKVKSIDDFIKNDRVYRYAMQAFGLDDMMYAKAMVKKILTEGIDSNTSLANKLNDSRFKELASVFNFKTYGETTTDSTDAKQGVVDRFVRLQLENQSGQQNEAVKLALYFARKAPTLSTPLGILADKNLLNVVQTALNIPESTGLMDVDRQAQMYAKRIDVADFKDPDKLNKFIIRFTSQWDMANGATNSDTASPAILFGGGASSTIVSSSVLASLQNLKFGGI